MTGGFDASANRFDWLGHGIYFYEAAPRHALNYASKHAPGDGVPCVLEASIDLTGCLDFHDLPAQEEYERECARYAATMRPSAGILASLQTDLLHPFDCRILNYMYANLEQRGITVPSVRSSFPGSRPAWQDPDDEDARSRITVGTRVEILVRDPAAIIGLPRIHNLSPR
jgi:hypothetical protein